MATLPSSLSLTNVAPSAAIISADHRNNYSAIQTAVNALVSLLGGGVSGQVLTATSSTDVAWGNGLPPGAVTAYAAAAAPIGWLLCDGTAVSRTTYSALYAIVATTYGVGDGSTTFNLPDLRGRVPVGKGANADVNALATSDGLADANRSPKHITTVTRTADVVLSAPATVITPGNASAAGGGADNNATGTVTVSQQPTFSGGPGGSRPTDTGAFLVLNYIVKT